jgi:hypothetical protein
MSGRFKHFELWEFISIYLRCNTYRAAEK